ncbi:MAG TPA: KAP family P-loop domain-containing protein [Cyanobacteria bacterium UBA8803]|nr:KAP family P-loop domain-containing protein [Cyanobacteria bacterium UBA9273]HBL58351.1 KAP family P-loop domain-containing protein [Cyanobacteria bacterium UBA8803]
MTLDLKKFFQATNPGKTLFVDNATEDQKYYIDFSSVRGGQIIEDLRDNITIWSSDDRSCQLFTGHIGCGKSTELLRLKADLEREGFHVVYFESSQDLEMGDVDVGDILLAIARRVSESLENLEKIQLAEPKGLKDLLKGAAKVLQTEIQLSAEANVMGVGKVAASTEGKFSTEFGLPGIGQVKASSEEGLSFIVSGIGKISAKAKASPDLRSKLRAYLEPRTNNILELINAELLEPAREKLKQYQKSGIVAIVDNLDRVDSTAKAGGRPQQEYLFVDRGEQLRGLNCHLIYTMPLGLRFSNDFNTLTQRFMVNPQVLPMVPVQLSDGSKCDEGMALLRQMVLARAFPDMDEPQRLGKISEIFDSPETLDRLCLISGGHVRNLLRLLNDAIKKQRGLPISRQVLEEVIRLYRNEQLLAITDYEWGLLRQVAKQKKVAGDDGYQTLIRSMFVYEYRYSQETWFDINPILADAKELHE